MGDFKLQTLDYVAFFGYLILLALVGFFAARSNRKEDTSDYFLAGRTLPWYVVGSSYISANISTEHFIGMIGAAMIYGICTATPEWSSIIAFSFLIWIFIPFLLSSKVYTAPEFLERRFNSEMRFFFAAVTVVSDIIAFTAPVIYGGGLVLSELLGWSMATSIVVIGIVAGFWAIFGGLKSVAWMDLLTICIKVGGGLTVTILGLYALSGDSHSLVDGFWTMIERNRANSGLWQQAVQQNLPHLLSAGDSYNRLSVIQPLTHQTTPWTHWVLSFFYIGLWYTVINQFMIQRVLGAKNAYHARMGIVFAGYLKLLLPFIVVVPGLIYFALKPEVLLQPWELVKPAADKTYVNLIRDLVPVLLRGVLLAALFGAIQSTVSAVLNSTATVWTIDLYQRYYKRDASEREIVWMGKASCAAFLIVSILLAFVIDSLHVSLFVYIQQLYTFFAPPFSAVFLLGTLWRRINGRGAMIAIIVGFAFGILVKLWVQTGAAPSWLEPYANQGALNWAICMLVCTIASLLTRPPRPEQITDDLTFNWRKINVTQDLGDVWYKSVTFWWALSVVLMFVFIIIFGVIL